MSVDVKKHHSWQGQSIMGYYGAGESWLMSTLRLCHLFLHSTEKIHDNIRYKTLKSVQKDIAAVIWKLEYWYWVPS
jgi:hypothetical protein